MVFCEEYNKKALEIAQEFKTEMQARIPQQLTLECKPNKLVLVVGMNPSFNISRITNNISRVTKKREMSEDDTRLLYSLEQENIDNGLNQIREIEEDAFKVHAYFDRVRDLAAECGFEDDWNHLDLFIMRETNQKEALKSVGYKEIKEENSIKIDPINKYGEAQLELFEFALEALNPKIIIVANTAASVIVSHYFNEGSMNTSFTLGGNLNSHPTVILSGMLGGQRALDRFSRLRLIKEINQHLHRVRSTSINQRPI